MKKKIRIADKFMGEPNSCFIVAEAGSNHNGSLELAKKLIESAKECGCDAVKFQAFKTENLVTKSADKGDYQKGRSSGKSQFQMLKGLEFSLKQHRALVKYADNIGIPIFFSVFDQDSVDLIEELGISIFKLGSGELTNIPLIKYIAKKGKPLILSTGMASDKEIVDAVNAFREEKNEQLILMNCSIGYPSRFEDANLRRVKYLEKRFGVLCGNSDHTKGIIVAIVAAALGTLIIEKHFTIDKNLRGPDHPMSVDPQEMKQLCNIAHTLEKNPVSEDEIKGVLNKINIKITKEQLGIILGSGDRKLSEPERNQRIWARKSIVAAKYICRDEVLTSDCLAIKRPEEGILPKDYEKTLGRRLKYSVKEGTPIKWDMLQ